jgi:hypothetical protein
MCGLFVYALEKTYVLVLGYRIKSSPETLRCIKGVRKSVTTSPSCSYLSAYREGKVQRVELDWMASSDIVKIYWGFSEMLNESMAGSWLAGQNPWTFTLEEKREGFSDRFILLKLTKASSQHIQNTPSSRSRPLLGCSKPRFAMFFLSLCQTGFCHDMKACHSSSSELMGSVVAPNLFPCMFWTHTVLYRHV